MTTTYKVEVQRNGKWWMVHVPDIDALTQARRLNEVEDMARSLIAVSTSNRLQDVVVEVTSIRGQSRAHAELGQKARTIKSRRNELRTAEEDLLRSSREFARSLQADGIPVRDIAELLGLSPQRVSQLLTEFKD